MIHLAMVCRKSKELLTLGSNFHTPLRFSFEHFQVSDNVQNLRLAGFWVVPRGAKDRTSISDFKIEFC